MRVRNRWKKRAAYATTAAVLGVGLAGVAEAISEWWTPSGASCPVFDSAIACQAYCAADQSRCGGTVECTFRTGAVRPQCTVLVPNGAYPEQAPPEQWRRPDAR